MSQPHRPRRAHDSAGEHAVVITGLRKTYRTRRGRQVAVNDLSMSVPAGGVHGFLGPNGAGKTTTIRMLLGLITADAGRATIFGIEVPQRLPEVVDRVGAIVEQPRFFPAFTGRQNLRLLAQGIGVPRRRVDEVLEEVGLSARARDRFAGYSLGMKQRLAVAATLLKDPDLLVFDEPTNGLDPAGIHEIRATMRGLAERGRTVLVSSHILSEVQQVADTVSIIGRGRLLAEGSVRELLRTASGGVLRVGVADPGRATDVLRARGWQVEDGDDGRLLVSADGAGPAVDAATLTRVLGEQQLWLHELTPVQSDLESYFLRLTAEEHLGTAQHQPAPAGPTPRHAAGPGGAR